jgi:hypothetical protein
MWVDYVRVYAREPVIEGYRRDFGPIPRIETAAVGFNFSVVGQESTELSPKQAAGASGVAQRNWNNLSGPNGRIQQLVDDEGDNVPGLTVAWSVPGEDQAWRSKKGKDWGFKRANLTLQTGYIQLGGKLSVTGIPYERFDVYVYLGADADQGSGSVTISSSSGGINANRTCFYWNRWLDGLFVVSEATSLETAEPSNCVVFEECTTKEFDIEWAGNLRNGWTGVTGVQIVERR